MKPRANVIPPNPPWQILEAQQDAHGYISIYYSDDLSALPVRWITKPIDNKSDPNLETRTYGLFSTCMSVMRSGVVNRGSSYLFFATRWKGERVLTGYYKIRWYARGVLGDYCLAADKIRFTSNPISLKTVDRKCGTTVSKWFRNMKLLTPQQCTRVRNLLQDLPDATDDYLAEIDRMERLNLKSIGYRYPGWGLIDKFSWELAPYFLNDNFPGQRRAKTLNTSPSGWWKCESCSKTVKNKALLKQCPFCKDVGTLVPEKLTRKV
jgi:hypothetical protein